ncbi:MAG: heme exporter protein CcmB, partial [Anaerolineae bacterium]
QADLRRDLSATDGAGVAVAFLRSVWAVAGKDLWAESHTREQVSAMLVFAVLAVLVFSFALDLQGQAGQAAAPGAFWATVLFASTIGLNRSFAREQASGAMDGLLLAPMDRGAIYAGKALANLAFVLVVEAVLLPLFTVLFDAALLRPDVIVVTVLGTVGYVAAGTLLAAVAVNTRAREVMLPVMLLPLAVPDLIAAVRATTWLLDGGTLAEVGQWLRLLVVYDAAMACVGLLTFGYVVEG